MKLGTYFFKGVAKACPSKSYLVAEFVKVTPYLNKLQYVKEKNELEDMYTSKYGPMTITETQGSSYNWINNPWPWDRTGGSKYV